MLPDQLAEAIAELGPAIAVSVCGLRGFLGLARWPHNGLNDDENRRLFESTKSGEIAQLVVKGLKNVFAAQQ